MTAIAESVLFQINSTNYNGDVFTIYKPQPGCSGFITTLRLTVDIKSIDATDFPYIPDDTPANVLQEILNEVALNTPFKEVVLFYKKGNGAWVRRAPIQIFNKEPYYDINLIRYFSDANTIDVSEDLSLGIQLKVGNVLASADTILVWGTAVEEKKNDPTLEAFGDRISALENLLQLFGAATPTVAGTNGLIPGAAINQGTYLLRGDRTWQDPSTLSSASSLVLGTTNITAYRGDLGNTAYNHSQTTGNPHGTSKADIGLSLVDNTADTAKPVSAAQQAALNLKADLANGTIPAAQLPAFVDDVLEFTTLAGFPTTGETGKLYVAINTNLVYRWTGTIYVAISDSLALGITSSSAYRGDLGNTAYNHSQTTGNPHGTSKADIGLALADNTADTAKPISTAQQAALNLKAPLGNPVFTGTVTTEGQIIFPSTQNPSANANTLDDYSEGTWTPVITYTTPGTSAITFSRNTGRYQKIGNRVFVSFDIRINTYSKGTASGYLIISGLPFTPRSGAGYDNNFGFLLVGNSPFSGIPNIQTATGLSGGNVLFIFKAVSGSVNVALDDPTNGALYWGQITYESSN